MPWMRVVLSQADIEADRENDIQWQFMGILAANGAPPDAGVFRKGNMFYFSPKAVEISSAILSSFRPMECPAPLRDDVEVFSAGNLNSIPFASQ